MLVCEGLPDALTATQAGYRSVAVLGANSPDATVAARLANHAVNLHLDVALVCDPDSAGRQVAATLTRLLADRGSHPIVVTPPAGDLNVWALAEPAWATVLDDQLATRSNAALDAGIDL
jgi:DNA primase